MSTLIDIKYALRLLFNSPKFTALTLAVLVGGLSISLFTFSFLYSTIYKPLPLPDGDSAKSVAIYGNGEFNELSAYEYFHLKGNVKSLAEFGIYDDRAIRISKLQTGKNYTGSVVREGFFEFSRTEAILGRTIQTQDTIIGANPVVVISYDVWKNELNGDEKVLEQTLVLNGQITDVVGVMPQGYRFPNASKLWLPLSDDVFQQNARDSENFKSYARIQPEVEKAQAEREVGQALNQIYQQSAKLFDLPTLEKTVELLTFQMAQTGGQGGIVFGFLNAISWLILMLACINVGNLLLARTIERQKETAIRAALGANTLRLVSQLMWEGILISVVGGILSLLLVGAALDYTELVLQSWLPSGGSFWWHYGMDIETFLMGVAFTFVTIMLSAFLPAWRSAHQDINVTLRDGTRGSQSKKAGRISRFLVTTQVFLVATLMLIGSISGFIAHKFINLELGDNYTDVMTARLSIPELKYPEKQQQLLLLQTLIEQIKQNSQVVDVVTNNWMGSLKVALEGGDYASEEDKPLIDTISVIGDTTTIGIELVAGRQFSRHDKIDARKTVLISQSMANRYWPGESPLEKRFSITIDDVVEQVFVVGVVTDRMNPSTLFSKLDAADEIYVSGLQFINSYQILLYRITPNTINAAEIFYQAMFNTDRNITLQYSVHPASKNRNKMRESMGLVSNVTFGTGFFALLLAMVGIYGLTANSVAQRTHEIGIRRAVGASDKNIIQLFLKHGARQLIIGLGLALVLFTLISFGFHNFTEGLFPVYFYYTQAAAVVIGLSLIVMLAIFIPTKRAVKMEPNTALRYQ
jgi:predicted permease